MHTAWISCREYLLLNLSSWRVTSIGPHESNPFSVGINLLKDQRWYSKLSDLVLLIQNPQNRVFLNKFNFKATLTENLYNRFLIKTAGKYENLILGSFLSRFAHKPPPSPPLTPCPLPPKSIFSINWALSFFLS